MHTLPSGCTTAATGMMGISMGSSYFPSAGLTGIDSSTGAGAGAGATIGASAGTTAVGVGDCAEISDPPVLSVGVGSKFLSVEAVPPVTPSAGTANCTDVSGTGV